jgi:hypothetical protein
VLRKRIPVYFAIIIHLAKDESPFCVCNGLYQKLFFFNKINCDRIVIDRGCSFEARVTAHQQIELISFTGANARPA